jgi:glycosyl hydrolase family 4
VGDLPLACAATCNASIEVQRMSVEAAVHGDEVLLKQAMLHDPLTAATCNPPEIWQMADEMLLEQAAWLPQYRKAVRAAKKRLTGAKRLGTNKSRGAARLRVKSVAEMRRNSKVARANAEAADKAAKTREKQRKARRVKA